MSVIDRDPEHIVMDAQWLAHRIDFQKDRFEFVFLPREAHRQTPFLDHRHIPADVERVHVPRRTVAGTSKARAPLHFIFHSGMARSTLMARALDWGGAVMALKEPAILGDLARYSRSGASAEETRKALDEALSLLARPFEPGEPLVVKSESLSIHLAEAILETRRDSQVLCLYAPLPVFLNSLAGKGLWGRLWGRKLLIGLLDAGIVNLGFSTKDYFAQTDLQVAACAWLTYHQHFFRLITRFGPERVRTLDSETFIGAPDTALLWLAKHFRLKLTQTDIQAIVTGPVFGRDSKTGDPYDPRERVKKRQEAANAESDEIALVVDWAAKVAEALGFPLELGSSLIR